MLCKVHARSQPMVKEMEKWQKTTPIRLMLATKNDPAGILMEHRERFIHAPCVWATGSTRTDLKAAGTCATREIFAS